MVPLVVPLVLPLVVPLGLAASSSFSPQELRADLRLSRNEATTSGEVRETSFVPGAAELVFRADRDSKGHQQLYAAPSDGSSTPAALGDSFVNTFELSPDGAWAVSEGVGGVHVRALNGGGSDFSLAEAVRFRVTPDSTRLVYLTSGDDLFVAPLDGSSAPVLLADLSALGTPGSLTVAPDSTRVLVAELDPGHLEAVALHSVALSGGAPLLLTPPLPVDRHHLGSIRIDPSSTRALYTLNELVPAPPPGGPPSIFLRELFSVPLDGSAASVRLSELGATLQSVVGVDPSGNVVFHGNAGLGTPSELFSVPLDASASPLRLHAPLPPGAACQSATLAADGSRVAFVLHFNASTISLYSAPPDGSAPAVLLSAADQVPGFSPVLSPDGTRAVYQSLVPVAPLRSVPLDGSAAPVTLVASLPPGMEVSFSSARVSADSTHVLFIGDLDTPGVPELYSVPLGGGARVRLNDPLTGGGSVSSLFVPTSGDEVAYLVQASSAGSVELHATTVSGATTPADVSQLGAGPLAGTVREHAGGNGRVVYRADHLVYQRNELFSVPLDGSDLPVRLHATPPAGGDVLEFRLGLKSGRVVFRGDVRLDNRTELFSAPLDGSAAGVLLHPAFPGNRNVTQFALSPDGARALYVADAGADELYQLYSVPTDASAAPVVVNGTLVTGGDVRDFVLDAAGTKLAYLADQSADEVVELWARPLDLSSAAVRISSAPVLGGDVDSFSLTPDGTRAVYLADQATNDVLELYVAPTDGSAPAVRVSPSLVFGGNVQRGFSIDPTGTRVVFRADALVNDQFELYSAPLDGSSPAVRLNPTLASAVDVMSFRLDPFGQEVVFQTYSPLSGTTCTLYSAPLDGAQPATLLAQPLIPEGQLSAFSIDPSAEQVLYLGLDPGETAWGLFRHRLDGSGPDVRLSPSGLAASSPTGFTGGDLIYPLDSRLVRVPLEGGPGLAVTRSYEGSLGSSFLLGGRVVFMAGERSGSSELYSTRLVPKVRLR